VVRSSLLVGARPFEVKMTMSPPGPELPDFVGRKHGLTNQCHSYTESMQKTSKQYTIEIVYADLLQYAVEQVWPVSTQKFMYRKQLL
jgi:hypothetical protein